MEYHDCSDRQATAISQRRGVQFERQLLRLGNVDLTGDVFGIVNRTAQGFNHRAHTCDFPYVFANTHVRIDLQNGTGSLIHVSHALVFVHRDDPFNHAP